MPAQSDDHEGRALYTDRKSRAHRGYVSAFR